MIGILTSGATLGVHVPGVLLARRLRECGVDAEVAVLESLLPPAKRATVGELKWAFHRDYRFALAARKLGRDTATDLDGQAVRALWRRWRDDGVRHLVTFSGYWLPVLHGYRDFLGEPVAVDLCRGDAAPMQSFVRSPAPPYEGAREIHLADVEAWALPWTIPVARTPPRAWGERDHRILVHGGGWGLGTYRQRAAELSERGLAVDLVAYETTDADAGQPGTRHFIIDPSWHPWHDGGFPPFAEVRAGSVGPFTKGGAYSDVFELARDAVAIVSKPGAGTMLDSLWAATPLVMLEPWSDSEGANARLWERLGYGIGFDTWRESGFSTGVLTDLQHNLRAAAAAVPDYAAELVAGASRVTA